MPEYKNRPRLDLGTPVWRYMNLDALISTLNGRRLRFTRVDTFDDPFEGSVPQKQIGGQAVIFGGANFMQMMASSVAAHYPGMAQPPREIEDGWTRLTRYRRAMTRSAHASCWSWGEESEALWRLYCDDKDVPGLGVALRTTLGRLEASVATHDLYVSPVTYRLYHEGDGFTNDMDAFMHKRRGFRSEQEIRLLKFDQAHYSAIIQKPPTAPELAPHLFLDWAVGTVVDEIVLSPYVDVAYEAHARALIATTDPTLSVPVILSELNPRRYAPGF